MGKKVIVLVIAVLIVGGAAYGLTRNKKSDNNSNSSNSNTSQNSSPNPSPTSSNSASKESTNSSSNSNNSSSSSQSTNAVSINNFAFSPKDITVKKGTTVTWTNNDSVTHTVQETDGKSGPKSNDLARGETYTYTFIAAGTYAYHCSIHPDMTGTVTVTE